MLWALFWIAVLFGFVALMSWSLGCAPNEAAAGVCYLGSIDIMGPLSTLGIIAGLSAFVVAPPLLLVALIAGLVCFGRRRW